jgi:hypothetical protein
MMPVVGPPRRGTDVRAMAPVARHVAVVAPIVVAADVVRDAVSPHPRTVTPVVVAVGPVVVPVVVVIDPSRRRSRVDDNRSNGFWFHVSH